MLNWLGILSGQKIVFQLTLTSKTGLTITDKVHATIPQRTLIKCKRFNYTLMFGIKYYLYRYIGLIYPTKTWNRKNDQPNLKVSDKISFFGWTFFRTNFDHYFRLC
jgi:hypothetical protein